MKSYFAFALVLSISGLGTAFAQNAPPPAPASVDQIAASVKAANAANLPPQLSEVVKMSNAGIDEKTITTYVESSPPFRLSADDVIHLRDAGVPSQVVTAMLQHGKASIAAPAPSSTPSIAGQAQQPPYGAYAAPSQPVYAESSPQVVYTDPAYVYSYPSYGYSYPSIGIGFSWGFPWYGYGYGRYCGYGGYYGHYPYYHGGYYGGHYYGGGGIHATYAGGTGGGVHAQTWSGGGVHATGGGGIHTSGGGGGVHMSGGGGGMRSGGGGGGMHR